MTEANILWIDDEIDLLKIHILFLEEKGYKVKTSNNSEDALDIIKEENFDIILLDENMPGKSGLDILPIIKKQRPSTPVVLITKNEEEDVMDEAIGSNVDDYLIKPVNPKQIVLSIKKNVDNKKLIREKTTNTYQSEFNKISLDINKASSFEEWVEIYKNIIHWELKIDKLEGNTMDEVVKMQKSDANTAFGKFISKNYINWFSEEAENRPKFIFDFFRRKIIPELDAGEKIFVIVVDNLRFDQWKTMQNLVGRYMITKEEEIWSSILPTATQYARNALFAGFSPLEISEHYPEYWLDENEEGGKNLYEKELLEKLFERYRRKVTVGYEKVLTNKQGEKVNENITNLLQNELSVVVYNFVDMLSHSRTEMKIVKELADGESAYRSLTNTWLEHSPLYELIKILAQKKIKTFITTDHGAVNIQNPIKVIGDKETTTNLRFKQGKNMNYKKNKVFEITSPEKAGLPSINLSSSYIFAYGNDFFAYPNNYNHYVKYYKNTFQHGGVSLEEMLIPVITLIPK